MRDHVQVSLVFFVNQLLIYNFRIYFVWRNLQKRANLSLFQRIVNGQILANGPSAQSLVEVVKELPKEQSFKLLCMEE